MKAKNKIATKKEKALKPRRQTDAGFEQKAAGV